MYIPALHAVKLARARDRSNPATTLSSRPHVQETSNGQDDVPASLVRPAQAARGARCDVLPPARACQADSRWCVPLPAPVGGRALGSRRAAS